MESYVKLWHDQAKFLGTLGMVVLGALAGFVYSDAERSFWLAIGGALSILTSILSCAVFSSTIIVSTSASKWNDLSLVIRGAYWLCVSTLCVGVVFFGFFVAANYREGPGAGTKVSLKKLLPSD